MKKVQINPLTLRSFVARLKKINVKQNKINFLFILSHFIKSFEKLQIDYFEIFSQNIKSFDEEAISKLRYEEIQQLVGCLAELIIINPLKMKALLVEQNIFKTLEEEILKKINLKKPNSLEMCQTLK